MSNNSNTESQKKLKELKEDAKAYWEKIDTNLTTKKKYADILSSAMDKYIKFKGYIGKKIKDKKTDEKKTFTEADFKAKLVALYEDIKTAMKEKDDEIKKKKETKEKTAKKEQNQTYKKRLANALGKKTAAKNLVEEYLA